ncbi:MAG: hypothetical protein EBR07_06165, partial [Planctomycetes bacterium]|nr:hypothetical protein [Planctomycetota bacterium]
MPTFTLNGTAIELEPQTRESFAWLAGQVYRRLHEGPPLPAILTVFAHEGTTTQGLPTSDARIQAILWTLWQIGIASARVEGDGDKREVKWDKGEHANIDTRPIIEHFTEEGINEGRALAAGLVVVAGRNGGGARPGCTHPAQATGGSTGLGCAVARPTDRGAFSAWTE